MEYQFECDFTPTVHKSANRIRKLSPGSAIVLLLLGIGLFIYVTFSAAITTILYGVDLFWILMELFSIVYLVYSIFMPEIRGYIAVRQFRKNIVSYHISFGDCIEIRQGDIRTYWKYTEINRVVRLKYHYELLKDKRMSIALDPDTMTGGTFPEFKQFLREKRPDLQIPE